MYNDFCSLIDSELVNKKCGNSKHKHKPWWCKELSTLRNKAKSARMLWLADKQNIVNKQSYLTAHKEFDSLVTICLPLDNDRMFAAM